MNGEPFIHLGGQSHHRSAPDVAGLFDHVATVAPGSWGSFMFAMTKPWVMRARCACSGSPDPGRDKLPGREAPVSDTRRSQAFWALLAHLR
ncbi:Imm7 family immunity protein [Streptomyces fagopyri]|uniref:Imm7 family immunity protein n=1 Tax=Streptomyces fagopyri TaxID=2662397 RepID=UPI00371154D6